RDSWAAASELSIQSKALAGVQCSCNTASLKDFLHVLVTPKDVDHQTGLGRFLFFLFRLGLLAGQVGPNSRIADIWNVAARASAADIHIQRLRGSGFPILQRGVIQRI